MAKKTMDELRNEHIERLKFTDVLTVEGELAADESAALDSYFRRFVATPDGSCIMCGGTQGGSGIEAVLGIAKFRWGLAHGEGYCGGCGYPARAFHRDVGPIKFLNMILQYHPDELSEQKPESECA